MLGKLIREFSRGLIDEEGFALLAVGLGGLDRHSTEALCRLQLALQFLRVLVLFEFGFDDDPLKCSDSKTQV